MARSGSLLTEAQWKKIAPLLSKPPKHRQGGRPWIENRRVLEGILWILRSGARWQDLPEKYPHPSPCWRRVRDWEEQGVWLNIWRAFLGEMNERQQLKWSESFLGGSFAPAKKGHRSRKNQAGKGNEVDGGGRRPGCSFGILPYCPL
jgi:transposase